MMDWYDVFWRTIFGLIALGCSWYFIREYYQRDRDRWRRKAEWLAMSLSNTVEAAYPDEFDKEGYSMHYFLDKADELMKEAQ